MLCHNMHRNSSQNFSLKEGREREAFWTRPNMITKFWSQDQLGLDTKTFVSFTVGAAGINSEQQQPFDGHYTGQSVLAGSLELGGLTAHIPLPTASCIFGLGIRNSLLVLSVTSLYSKLWYHMNSSLRRKNVEVACVHQSILSDKYHD